MSGLNKFTQLHTVAILWVLTLMTVLLFLALEFSPLYIIICAGPLALVSFLISIAYLRQRNIGRPRM